MAGNATFVVVGLDPLTNALQPAPGRLPKCGPFSVSSLLPKKQPAVENVRHPRIRIAPLRTSHMLRLPTLAALALLSACAETPTNVHLTITASRDLNPGPGGAANPAQVRVFLLKNPEKFSNADYFQLADKEKTVLGEDLISREEYTVRPGDTRTIDSPVQPGERFVGISVAYRDIDHATWRAITPIRSQVKATLGAERLALDK